MLTLRSVNIKYNFTFYSFSYIFNNVDNLKSSIWLPSESKVKCSKQRFFCHQTYNILSLLQHE